MLRINQARSQAIAVGEPLLVDLAMNRQGPEAAKFLPRRGQLAMVAAAPGGCKSFLTHNILQNGDGHGNKNKGIYFSADSDAWTMFMRTIALETHWKMSDVENGMKENPEYFDQIAAKASQNIWFDFHSEISGELIANQIKAYAELHGEFPEFIVVDNLKNLDVTEGGRESDYDLEENMEFLHEVAHITGAAVIVTHHLTGQYEEIEGPPPLGSVRGKVTKTAELVITLNRPQADLLRVNVVKNRGGKSGKSGEFYGLVRCDTERGLFE